MRGAAHAGARACRRRQGNRHGKGLFRGPAKPISCRRGAIGSATARTMSDNGRRGEEGPGTGVIVKAKPKTKKPSMYKV